MRTLLVEDDLQIGQSLLRALQDADYSVDWVRDGIAGRDALAATDYTVVLLDLGLPGMSGIELLKAARAAGNTVPVLILTARDDLDSRVQGLDVGADDYLLKPFEVPEVLARIRAVLRRKAGYAASRLGDDSLCLDLDNRTLTCDGVTTVLSAREFALMLAFLERPGTIPSARSARRPTVRLGQGSGEQRCRRADPLGAQEVRGCGDPQCARPRLDRHARRCREGARLMKQWHAVSIATLPIQCPSFLPACTPAQANRVAGPLLAETPTCSTRSGLGRSLHLGTRLLQQADCPPCMSAHIETIGSLGGAHPFDGLFGVEVRRLDIRVTAHIVTIAIVCDGTTRYEGKGQCGGGDDGQLTMFHDRYFSSDILNVLIWAMSLPEGRCGSGSAVHRRQYLWPYP